jgi:hypothetical protein
VTATLERARAAQESDDSRESSALSTFSSRRRTSATARRASAPFAFSDGFFDDDDFDDDDFDDDGFDLADDVADDDVVPDEAGVLFFPSAFFFGSAFACAFLGSAFFVACAFFGSDFVAFTPAARPALPAASGRCSPCSWT